jgi:hypothetical protein
MPDFISALAQRYALQLMPPTLIEYAQLHFLGIGGEHREIDALTVPGRAARVGLARPHRPDGAGFMLCQACFDGGCGLIHFSV